MIPRPGGRKSPAVDRFPSIGKMIIPAWARPADPHPPGQPKMNMPFRSMIAIFESFNHQ